MARSAFEKAAAGRPPAAAKPPGLKAAPIVTSFNTWAFKREQPSDLARLHDCVLTALEHGQPVEFVLYWGKGLRTHVGEPEQRCLAYLKSMSTRIECVYQPGARFVLVCTDTHARLNGHSEADIARYFDALRQITDTRLFSCRTLSSIVDEASFSEASSEQPDFETMTRLEKCAAKWFFGEGSTVDAARRYFTLNMVEKRAIEIAFPHAIFITFNGSEYRTLFPDDMPIFYMYSLKKGFSVKPWFLEAPAEPLRQQDCEATFAMRPETRKRT